MANYYITQMRAFEEIDKRLNSTLQAGSNVNIPLFILEFSKSYPISPKTIQKRVELFVLANKDSIEVKGDEVMLI